MTTEKQTDDQIEETTMEEMMDEIDKTIIRIQEGDIIKGVVLDVTEEEVVVNIGYGADGIVPKSDLVDDDQISLKDIVQIGEEIEVYVEQVDDGEGNVLLSKQQADAIVVWEELQGFLEKKQTFEIRVKEAVKGGVVASVRGVRAFIPASLLSYQYVEDLNEWVGKDLTVLVEEIDVEKKRIILSRKAVELLEREEKKKELFASIKKGEKRKGIVQRLMNYGAFVDLGGVDGLIHISDLAWTRVKHPSDILAVGDEVEVRVVDFDPEKQKISLALKDVKEDPWEQVMHTHKVNEIVTGKVVRLLDFGAFVQLDSGIDGLVHVSQISEKHIANPSEVLSIGDEVKVKVLEIKPKEKRMSLSIKDAEESFDGALLDYADTDGHTATIGDLLKGKFTGL